MLKGDKKKGILTASRMDNGWRLTIAYADINHVKVWQSLIMLGRAQGTPIDGGTPIDDSLPVAKPLPNAAAAGKLNEPTDLYEPGTDNTQDFAVDGPKLLSTIFRLTQPKEVRRALIIISDVSGEYVKPGAAEDKVFLIKFPIYKELYDDVNTTFTRANNLIGDEPPTLRFTRINDYSSIYLVSFKDRELEGARLSEVADELERGFNTTIRKNRLEIGSRKK